MIVMPEHFEATSAQMPGWDSCVLPAVVKNLPTS
jgi:hypothetical protein